MKELKYYYYLDEQIKKNGMGGKHNIQGNDQE
jgi:hypothetical protein